MTIEEYKALNKGRELPPEKFFKQTAQACKAIKETTDGLQVDFTISTATVDRDQDSINVDGWDLENYEKNPVILWTHNRWEPPIGKAVKVWTEDGALKSTAQFPVKDLYPFGHTIGEMYKGGFLHAVSVGFKSLEARWSVDEENRPWGIDYNKQELLEYSCVPIPANPEALLDAKADGIDVTQYFEMAVKCLDLKDGSLIPVEIAEKIYSLLKSKSTFFIPKTSEVSIPRTNNIGFYEKQIQLNENWRNER